MPHYPNKEVLGMPANIINNNIAYSRAMSDLSSVDRQGGVHRERLTSGSRVTSGRDDAGHLIVSEGMRGEIGGLTAGVRNAEKAINQIRTAEGAANEVNGILIRMRELATQASNGTLNDMNREALDSEFNQLKEYIDRIAKLTSYNDQSLLSGFGNEINEDLSTMVTDSAGAGIRRIVLSGADVGTYTFSDQRGDGTITLGDGTISQTVDLGTRLENGSAAEGTTVVANFDRLGVKAILAGNDVQGAAGVYDVGDLDGKTLIVEAGTGGTFQLGSDGKAADRLEYHIEDLSVDSPLLNNISISTESGARAALGGIDAVIDRISGLRGTLGAIQNRLEHTLNFTEGAIESVVASESTIRDADVAFESSQLARTQLLRDFTMAGMIQSTIPVDIVMSLLG